MSKLGEKVKLLRTRQGWTQETLAKKAGVDSRTVRRMETGEQRRFALETLTCIAGALQVPVSNLVELTEEAPRPQAKPPQVTVITTGSEFYAALSGSHSYRVTADDAEGHERDLVRSLHESIETADIWTDLSPGQRYDEEAGVTDLLRELRALGWSVEVEQTRGTRRISVSGEEQAITGWINSDLRIGKFDVIHARKEVRRLLDALEGASTPAEQAKVLAVEDVALATSFVEELRAAGLLQLARADS